MKLKKKILIVAVMAALSGCSTATMKPINEGVAAVEKEATVATAAIRNAAPLARAPESTVKKSNNVWFPVTKVESQLPPQAVSALKRQVAVNRKFLTLNETASYITALTGIPVSVNMSAIARAAQQDEQNQNAGTGGAGSTSTVPAIQTQNGGFGGTLQQLYHQVTYTGPMSGLLDLVASRYNIDWEWDKTSVRFFKTKSKTFRLTALPGDTSLSSRIGTSSSGGSSGSGSGDSNSGSGSTSSSSSELNAGVEFTGLSVWTGIEDSIKTMLSDVGKVTVTPATGTVTVEDTPLVLSRVEKFIDNQNDALSKQVVINVKVLAVELNDSNEYGINWDVVYENLNRSIGIGITNTFAPTVGATNLAFRVLSGSMFDGSSAMISALSQQGKVSQVTSASLVTINNQPAPIQVGRQTTYLASSTTTIGTGGAGNTVSLSPGVITTGFSMNVLPHILDNGKMMLQYSGDISALTKIPTVTSGDTSIQTPEIDTRNFMQRVIMNTGETLVVTGFEQFTLDGNTQGPGNAEAIALGGGVKTKKGKSQLVVLIQPMLPR